MALITDPDLRKARNKIREVQGFRNSERSLARAAVKRAPNTARERQVNLQRNIRAKNEWLVAEIRSILNL